MLSLKIIQIYLNKEIDNMNIDTEANALNEVKSSKEYIIAKNKSIKVKNRDVRFRNFLRRKHK